MGNSELSITPNNIELRNTDTQARFGIPNTQYSCKIVVLSKQEEREMLKILQKRLNTLSKSQFVCSLSTYFKEEYMNNEKIIARSCRYQKEITILYQPYHMRLSEIPLSAYEQLFPTNQIYHLIRCICLGLLAFRKINVHHGDIFPDMICRTNKTWQLIDKDFNKFGLGAYQTVLEGENAYLSPSQMLKLKYGFIKESPIMKQSNDIFALGMVALQLGSKCESSKCYYRNFIRLNEEAISYHIHLLQNIHGPKLSNLVCEMLQYDEQKRINIQGILKAVSTQICTKQSIKQSRSFDRIRSLSSFSHLRLAKQCLEDKTFIYRSNHSLLTKNNSIYSELSQNISEQNRNGIRIYAKDTNQSKRGSFIKPYNSEGQSPNSSFAFNRESISPLKSQFGRSQKTDSKQMFSTGLSLASSLRQQANKPKRVVSYFKFQSIPTSKSKLSWQPNA